MPRNRVRILAAVTLMAALAAGCAHLNPELAAPADVTQASAQWLDAQKSVIADRAKARWQALIDGDFERAYAFESPARRSVLSLQQYRGNFGNSVPWQLATVKSVEYDPDNVARVLLEIEYQPLVKGAENARGIRQMAERWLYSDGGWWYISR